MRPRHAAWGVPAAITALTCATIVLSGCGQTSVQAPLTTSSLPPPEAASAQRMPPPAVQQPPAYGWNGNQARTAYGAPPAPPRQAPVWQSSPRPPYQQAAIQPAIPPPQPYRAATAQLPAQQPYGLGSGRVVEVMPGDTLYSIARRNAVTVAALVDTNHLTGPSIRVGQRLALPASAR